MFAKKNEAMLKVSNNAAKNTKMYFSCISPPFILHKKIPNIVYILKITFFHEMPRFYAQMDIFFFEKPHIFYIKIELIKPWYSIQTLFQFWMHLYQWVQIPLPFYDCRKWLYVFPLKLMDHLLLQLTPENDQSHPLIKHELTGC